MTKRETICTWLAAVLLTTAGGSACAVAEAQDGGRKVSRGAALETVWFARHVDPRNDAEFLALEVDDSQRDDLWLLARRYRGARGEGDPFHELWRFESGERRRVFHLSSEQVAPYSHFAALRRLDGGEVVVAFLSPEGLPLVFRLNPGADTLRDGAGGAALRELAPLSAIAVHPGGDVVVATAHQGLSMVARFGPDGAARWRHTFQGTIGELAHVLELAVLGADVVALGFRTPAGEDAARAEAEAALVSLGADGRPGAPAVLPEQPGLLIASPVGEVAVAMGRFLPWAAVPVGTGPIDFEPDAPFLLAAFGPAPPVLETDPPALAIKSTATLATELRRYQRLVVARTCGNLFAYAGEEQAAEHGVESIRLALVDESGEIIDKILTGAGPDDPTILGSLSLVPHGEALYVAATIVQVLETREIRSGIDVYRLDLDSVCGADH